MFTSIASKSTDALWSIAKTTVSGGHSSALRWAWHTFFTGTKTCLASITKRHRLRRAARELESLDDRLLKDIGVSRSAIGAAVRYGREI
jgi:uncharacterized protein YjiS (DUF1127 family)